MVLLTQLDIANVNIRVFRATEVYMEGIYMLLRPFQNLSLK